MSRLEIERVFCCNLPVIEFEIPLRVTLIEPPAGVLFAVQRGRGVLVSVTRSTGKDLSFDLAIRIKGDPDDGAARFLGEFAQGPAGGKFVYVNSGMMAGDMHSCWTRRAKIHLSSLTWSDLLAARDQPNRILEARIAGTGRDGGPSCATVPLLGNGWHLVKR